MTTLKPSEIRKMNAQEREKKLKELKLELMKARAKSGKASIKEIKRIIARILTINKSESEELKDK